MRSRLLPALLVFGLLLCQAAILQHLFPFENLRSPEGIYNEDYGKTLYYTELGRTFLSTSFRLNGYTPDFYAGFRTHPTYHACTFLQIVAFLLPRVPVPFLLNASVYLLPLVLPFLFAGAARLFGLRPLQSALAAVFGCLYFYFNGTYYLYWVGSIFYLWAVYLAPLAAALLVSWLRSGRALHGVGAALLLPLVIMMHPYAALPLASFLLPALFVLRKRLSGRTWICLAGIATLTCVVNLPWLVDFFRPAPANFREIIALMKPQVFFHRLPPWVTLQILSNPVQLAFLALAVWGCRNALKQGGAERTFWPAVTALSLLLSVPLLLLPHFFFMVPMRLFTFLFANLAFPAAIGLSVFIGTFLSPERWRRRPIVAARFAGLVAVMILVSFLWSYQSRRPVFSAFGDVRPFVTEMPESVAQPSRWILEHTDDQARVLFEDQKIHTYFGIRPVLHVQTATGRGFIGGPVNDTNNRALQVDFHDGHIGFRKLATIPRPEFTAFLENYNIGWVLCWSDAARAYFHAWPELFRYETTAGGMDCFTVLRRPSYFLIGEGEVGAGYNRIDLWDMRPDGDRVRIAYHHVPGMKLHGRGRLNPVYLDGDPTPILEILDPGSEATILYDP